MATPAREDFGTIIRDIQQRLDRVERAQRNPTLYLPSSVVPPANPGGGILYVSAGSLHYLGSGGSNTTLGPA